MMDPMLNALLVDQGVILVPIQAHVIHVLRQHQLEICLPALVLMDIIMTDLIIVLNVIINVLLALMVSSV